MIKLTKLNGKSFILNAWHIEQMEETPDTIITLANGKKIAVKERVDEVVGKSKQFYKDTTLRTAISFQKGNQGDE
ncbi:flagellar FlbD family protein [Ammoniphilus resinae]|uniref:Flagellar protein FlbD n=1 Tax=Ammoniphilus resinae TaxID=861532 RepID=A0ABS4GKW7_9BACL|nr:flagellar FlbD family protein [Ammoniphilus resinae]MBP1930792.1 flagellar protein FlbD [Ammoniphilus resinae]